MAKKKEPQSEHALTKKQLSHWQKQALRQRIIGITGIITVVAVIGIIVSGWYYKQYNAVDKPMRQTVVQVNDQKFSTAYFIDMLKYFVGTYTDYASYYVDYTEKAIEQVALINQGAAALGYSVTEADIDTYIKENSLEDNQAVRDFARAQLLNTKLGSDYFGPDIPTTSEYRDVLAMFPRKPEPARRDKSASGRRRGFRHRSGRIFAGKHHPG